VGSRQSKKTLTEIYGIQEESVSTLPYPIDLSMFRPAEESATKKAVLRVLWLGRIIPRKRLDLFLRGLELAIRQGVRVRATIVGGMGFVPGYEKLIESFPFPDRLSWIKSMPRTEVPALLRQHDVLAQPSDEENFGSSVAEAQACGLPVIVGRTNGNADYLCPRDIHLADDRPESFANALRRVAADTKQDTSASRALAEKHFEISRVTSRLSQILRHVVDQTSSCPRVSKNTGLSSNRPAHLRLSLDVLNQETSSTAATSIKS
jgi:glycosyltransferase involved in cell wall biosynthesis